MRASSSPDGADRLLLACALVAAAFAWGATPSSAQGSTQVSRLEPAFRLPAGGAGKAGPIVDGTASPALAWLLSDDRTAYALTETGVLTARVAFRGEPAAYLALDPFQRILVVLDGRWLAAYTRAGNEAWRCDLGTVPSFSPAFGSDGRAFVLAGGSLVCLNAAGGRLWSYEVSGPVSCPPAVDGAGRPVLGLADGSLIILSPYGEELFRAGASAPASAASVIAPMEPGPGLPILAAGLADGRVLLLEEGGGLRAMSTSAARGGTGPVLDLSWDGAVLYGLDSGGRAFALSASGARLWSAPTSCREGRLALFPLRVLALGKGRAVSLSPQGEVFRELDIANATGLPVPSPAGLVFSAGQDWILAAYRFEGPLGPPRRARTPPYPALDEVAAEILAFDLEARESGRQLVLLADIEKSLGSGSIGKDERRAAAYCAAVASGEFELAYPQAERRFRGNPLPRARACSLLGRMGSPAYRSALAEVLDKDVDQAVRAAACEALGAIGVDPGGESAAAFLAAAAKPVDERTAFALIGALERLALRSGTPPGAEAVRAFLKLTGKPYGQAVRDRASAALGRIAGTIGP